jgi:hypothetical protein
MVDCTAVVVVDRVVALEVRMVVEEELLIVLVPAAEDPVPVDIYITRQHWQVAFGIVLVFRFDGLTS